MQCETVHAQLADFLSNALTAPAARGNPSSPRRLPCLPRRGRRLRGDVANARTDPSPAPDSARMQARLDRDASTASSTALPVVVLPRSGAGSPPCSAAQPHRASVAAAAAAVLVSSASRSAITSSAGAFGAPPDELVAMRGELRDLREMVTLSLMQQQSASDRLKGVSWSGQIDCPGSEVVAALLDALMHDPNVNVRLATIDALERFARRTSSAAARSRRSIARCRRSCRSR